MYYDPSVLNHPEFFMANGLVTDYAFVRRLFTTFGPFRAVFCPEATIPFKPSKSVAFHPID